MDGRDQNLRDQLAIVDRIRHNEATDEDVQRLTILILDVNESLSQGRRLPTAWAKFR